MENYDLCDKLRAVRMVFRSLGSKEELDGLLSKTAWLGRCWAAKDCGPGGYAFITIAWTMGAQGLWQNRHSLLSQPPFGWLPISIHAVPPWGADPRDSLQLSKSSPGRRHCQHFRGTFFPADETPLVRFSSSCWTERQLRACCAHSWLCGSAATISWWLGIINTFWPIDCSQ